MEEVRDVCDTSKLEELPWPKTFSVVLMLKYDAIKLNMEKVNEVYSVIYQLRIFLVNIGKLRSFENIKCESYLVLISVG